MNKLLSILIVAVSLLSCNGYRWNGRTETGDTVSFKYSQLIVVEQYDGYRLVTIKNPWKEGKVLHRYQLIPYDDVAPHHTEHGATIVRVPLQRSVVFTSMHAALLAELGAQNQVAGVADLKYMKVPYVQNGVRKGRILDCGDGMAPVVEKIIDAEADAILLSPFENSGGYGRLEKMEVPLIECAEYMEHSPLARAEWIRFYGMLYGKERVADSLFAVVDSSYHALKTMAATMPDSLTVMMDKQTGSVWYMPGGNSTIGRMLQDAKCCYPFANDDRSGSLPLPFETVLEKCGEADVWLFRYDSDQPMTKALLEKEQKGYSQLRPLREGNVYGCNVLTSMFYEETPFRPDLLLQDYIGILHPQLRKEPLRYYHKIE